MSAPLSPEARAKRADTLGKQRQARAEALVENLEWMISQKQGEYAVLAAVGYQKKPDGLKRQLCRIGRPDLIPSIFEYDHHINGRHQI